MTLPISRRMFLKGAGGALLAIPFLPSITTRAFASGPVVGPVGKCFMGLSTFHGDIWGGNMYPDEALLTQETPYAGRQVRHGTLPTAPNAQGVLQWSPVLAAHDSLLTPSLAQKFNVLRGMDICWSIGHHRGQNLGNFTQSGSSTTHAGPWVAPTIDQVMAYSPSFYSAEDLASRMTQRSMCISSGSLSWNYTSPTSKQGDLVVQPAHASNVSLYKYLFQPGTIYNGIDQSIVDGIKGSYALLKKHPRLSKGDLIRLNGHIEKMYEVERLVGLAKTFQDNAMTPDLPNQDTLVLEGTPNYPADPALQALSCELMIEMIVLAFSTGTCRIGTWPNRLRFLAEQIGNWHGMIAHASLGTAKAQQLAVAYNRGTFEHIMVKLAAKMDEVLMADGTTLLDNSLIVWTNEHGQVTHQAGPQYPVITAGSAGGYFKTGKFVDFSDQTAPLVTPDANTLALKPGILTEYAGLYYNQFLANALLAMDIPANEWEHFSEVTEDGPEKSTKTKGYGFHQVQGGWAKHYEKAKPFMSDKLPIVT